MAGLTLLAYAPALRCGFVWDDDYYIVQNVHLREWSQAPSFFTDEKASSGGLPAMIYRPIRNLSYLIDYKIWGLNPAGFHLTNLLIHVLTVLALWGLARRWSGSAEGAWFAAAWFAIHPALTEAVVWVKSRDSLLAGLFAIAGFWLFTGAWRRLVGWRWAAAVAALAAASYFSYLISLCLPVMMVLSWAAIKHKPLLRNVPAMILALAGCFTGAAVFFVARRWVIGATAQSPWPVDGELVPTMITMIPVTVDYLRLMLAPAALNADYCAYPHYHSLLEGPVLASLAILSVLAALVFLAWRRRDRRLFLALIWIPLFLAPVSNVIPTMQLLAERFIYIPAAGAALTIACGWRLHEKRQPAARKKRLVVAALILALFFVGVERRIPVWSDGVTLFRETALADPLNPRALSNWGYGLYDAGRTEESINVLEEYRRRFGLRGKPGRTLALGLRKTGRLADALEVIEASTGERPDVASRALLALIASENPETAVRAREICEALRGDMDACEEEDLIRIAVAWQNIDNLDEAESIYLGLLDSAPDNANVLRNLGRIAWAREDWGAAERYYARLLAINPGDREAQNALHSASVGATNE